MGRMFYATAQTQIDKRVHVITTDRGTVVLAMRPPNQVGERGYWIGIDFTVRDAVEEMLTDWSFSDDGPGWVYDGNDQGRVAPGATDDTFGVTVLAAYDAAYDRLGDQEDNKPDALGLRERPGSVVSHVKVEFCNGVLVYRVVDQSEHDNVMLAISPADKRDVRIDDRCAVVWFPEDSPVDGDDRQEASLLEVLP
jgi:hypothetical protein